MSGYEVEPWRAALPAERPRYVPDRPQASQQRVVATTTTRVTSADPGVTMDPFIVDGLVEYCALALGMQIPRDLAEAALLDYVQCDHGRAVPRPFTRDVPEWLRHPASYLFRHRHWLPAREEWWHNR